MHAMQDKVCAIVVTYNPAPDKLSRLIERLRPQVHDIVVVDNGSEKPIPCGDSFIQNETNVGLATALNQGIHYARELGSSHIATFDQDSLPAPTMISDLLDDLREFESKGMKAAVIGPTLYDERSGSQKMPFIRFGFPRNFAVEQAQGPVECDFLITSGSLTSIKMALTVGPMMDDLFIDSIDTEWCFRAKHCGLAVIGSNKATMVHELGERMIRVRWLNRVFPDHSPSRLYYIMRNKLLLYRLKHTPLMWIAQDVIHVPLLFAIFALFVPNRRANVSFMVRGMVDGLFGRSGARP
jgi:rhamnosyltransferase